MIQPARSTCSLFVLTSLFAILSTADRDAKAQQQTIPTLAASSLDSAETEVELTSAFNLRFSEPVAPKTLGEIRLFAADIRAKSIPVSHSTDLTNASVTVVPLAFLDRDTSYVLVGTNKLKSADGRKFAPFELEFRTTTKGIPGGPESFFKAKRFDKTRSMTTVLFGPDRKLYAASAFGEIVCWNIDAEGKPGKRTTIFQDPSTSRQYIDLEWDPEATAQNLVLWVSYAERLTSREAPDYYFTGTIARLKIEDSKVVSREVMVKGLPHGREVQGGHETLPHQPNGLCFKDGMLYQSVGSTSSSGGPANWGIAEQPYSACLLQIDYQRIKEPVDLAAGKEQTLVRRFATGIRNAIEVVAHSNGKLYTAVNMNDRGSRSDGVPDDPDIPGDQNALIKQITPNHECLYILQEGAHYGFPNPSIGNYVLSGGNPTSKQDPFEITDYPVGTQPEAGFSPDLMFPIWKWGGTSPDGMIEYLPENDHPLKHALLCCFFFRK